MYRYKKNHSFVEVVADGSQRLTTSEEVQNWIAIGNTVEAYTSTPLDQIAAIEAANPITHRNLRDLSMTVAQIAAAITGADPMVNPAVQQIAALEAQIAALRAQI